MSEGEFTLIGAVIGAGIALVGSVLTQRIAGRQERDARRADQEERRLRDLLLASAALRVAIEACYSGREGLGESPSPMSRVRVGDLDGARRSLEEFMALGHLPTDPEVRQKASSAAGIALASLGETEAHLAAKYTSEAKGALHHLNEAIGEALRRIR